MQAEFSMLELELNSDWSTGNLNLEICLLEKKWVIWLRGYKLLHLIGGFVDGLWSEDYQNSPYCKVMY